MITLGFFDYEWTLFLQENRIDAYGEFMRRTLFEGSSFGASDPAIIFQIMTAAAYFLSSRQSSNETLIRLRPFLGFVFFSSLVAGLGLVHSFKWIIGRARPDLVFNGTYPFTHWFQFGPQFVSDGIFYGSFPSGHTATVFLLMTVSYWMVGIRHRSFTEKTIGVIWAITVLLYSASMAVGRAMTLHHWLSDCVGIIFMAWISLHVIFFYILKVPAQVEMLKQRGIYPLRPRYWELSLLWRLLFITLGIMCVITGFRSIAIGKATWLVFLVIPGLFIAYGFSKNLSRTYRTILSEIQR